MQRSKHSRGGKSPFRKIIGDFVAVLRNAPVEAGA